MLELEPRAERREVAPPAPAVDVTDEAQTAPGGVRVSVIIPALNEAANIPHVLARIPAWVHEVVLVDGHSTDGTSDVAQTVWPNHHIVAKERRSGRDRRNGPRLVAQERRGNGMSLRLVMQTRRGKGNALHSGVLAATGDIVVLIDADGSTDPQEIGRFVETLVAGADFAKGSRFLRGAGTSDMPPYRQIGNGALVLLTNILFRTRYTDITYGYNAFWKRHGEVPAWDIDGWPNEIITNIRVARHGLRVVEVPSFEHDRIAGEAKLQGVFRVGWTILLAILRERLRPYRPVTTPPVLLETLNVVTIGTGEPAARQGEQERSRAVPA